MYYKLFDGERETKELESSMMKDEDEKDEQRFYDEEKLKERISDGI
jgi:hypothetical protein